jgi:Ribbon-helix-helix protein, copG family
MAFSASSRSINIRLPEQLFETLRTLAKRRGTSMNKVVEGFIKDAAEQDRKQRLREEFERIGNLAEQEQSVDFALEAQGAVIRADE